MVFGNILLSIILWNYEKLRKVIKYTEQEGYFIFFRDRDATTFVNKLSKFFVRLSFKLADYSFPTISTSIQWIRASRSVFTRIATFSKSSLFWVVCVSNGNSIVYESPSGVSLVKHS